MRASGLALMLVIASLVAGHPGASAALVLYDDFSSGVLDPGKWFGSNQELGAASPTTEMARVVRFGALELRLNQYGRHDTDSGRSAGHVRLQFKNPASVTAVQAGVRVLGAEAGACPANTAAGQALAYFIGEFFNDGSSTGAGDFTGDIMALIGKFADSARGNVIDAAILRCTNGSCSTFEELTRETFTATWAPGQSHTLGLAWDAPNKQFIATVKPPFGGAETIPLLYTQSDSSPAVRPIKEFISAGIAVNCNGSRKRAFMDALFDNVHVQVDP